MADTVVELRDISKRYSAEGHWVNRHVSLDLRGGEILCLAGENGAGKTTLMKILYGLTPPTEGEIVVKGRKAIIRSPLQANKLGIGMVHQRFMLFPELTAAQNVVMGAEPMRFGVFYDAAAAERQVREVIDRHDFSVKPRTPVGDLSVGEMQQVEILKMLYRNVDILILDEPTAVLTDREIAALFRTFRLLAESGKSLILITHKLKEIKGISDRVAIMRRGEMIALRETSGIGEFEISRLMVGRDTERRGVQRRRKSRATGKAVVTFEDVTVMKKGRKQPLLDRVSFTARAGEILAFAGVGGNGLDVLEAVLGGFIPITDGRAFWYDRDISRLGTRELRKQGLAYVPADRIGTGSAGEAGVWENLIVNRRRDFFSPLFLNRRKAAAFARDLIDQYGIAGNADQKLFSLSGGNIQKVILAREIEQYRDYIVFSEPAWGLDIAASGYVYEKIRELKEKGAAVILISSNLDEILSLAGRVIVLYRGAVAAELCLDADGGDAGGLKEKIGLFMTGVDYES
jgi:simple sugar transport system ATP-binding protein